MFCPICGKEMEIVGEHPDTGTDTDFWEERCENGHRFACSENRQLDEVELTQIEDVEEGVR